MGFKGVSSDIRVGGDGEGDGLGGMVRARGGWRLVSASWFCFYHFCGILSRFLNLSEHFLKNEIDLCEV